MSTTALHLVESAPLPHLLALPAGAPPEGRWPVLCFLHGRDEGPPTPVRDGATRHGPLSASASTLATAEFIVLAPQLPARGDLWHRHADAVLALVGDVHDRHGGDPARTCLTGFSFGGNGVFDLAIALRDVWAALWAVDPTRVPQEDPGRPVWLSSGEVSRRGERAFVERLRLQPRAVEGSGERVFSDEGLGHVQTATRAYADDAIFRWLLQRRLPSPAGAAEA